MAKGKKPQRNNKKTEEILSRLKELQAKNPVKTTIEEEVRLIRDDRDR